MYIYFYISLCRCCYTWKQGIVPEMQDQIGALERRFADGSPRASGDPGGFR